MTIGIDARLYRSSAAGIGRYSQNLIKNLIEIDSEDQYILFMTPEDKKEFNLPNKNVKIVETNIPHYSLSEQTKLIKIIENESPDLMHFLNFNFPIKYKGKFITTIHDLTLFKYPNAAKNTSFLKQIVFKYVMKKACKNSTKIIAVSESTKKDIIETFGIESEKIKVIYEAADDKKEMGNEKLEMREKYTNDEPMILYVGQFREHKNIKGLIQAYKILKKKMPVRLVLIGKVSNEIIKYIDNEPDLGDTLMPGFVSDAELAVWYKTADVFVFPSFYEGFGLPGLEAMQVGLPVVAANRTSLPEIYGNAALYFDPLKPEDIADKIKIVLQKSEVRNELIETGKIQANKYSWKKTAQETLEIYKEISNIKSQKCTTDN